MKRKATHVSTASVVFIGMFLAALVGKAIARDRADDVGRQTHLCHGAQIVFEDRRDAGLEGLCEGVSRALTLFRSCGFTSVSSLKIVVDNNLEQRLGYRVFAAYFLKDGRIRILGNRKFREDFSKLPELDKVSWSGWRQSTIVHEVVHFLLERNAPERIAWLHSEYVASALQIRLLDDKDRSGLMDAFPKFSNRNDPALINEFIYSFSPYMFALVSHRHFERFSDTCAHLKDVMVRNRIEAGQASMNTPR